MKRFILSAALALALLALASPALADMWPSSPATAPSDATGPGVTP